MINLPLLTGAALANGLNPCGIGMMITFFGYLLVFMSNVKKKELLKMGGVYLLAVFFTYLFIGLIFFGVAYYLQRLWIAGIFKGMMGGMIMIAGLIQVKDGLWPDLPIHLKMPGWGSEKINKMLSKMSLPMAALVGAMVTAFSTPCMLPLYVGTATVLARSGLPTIAVLGYFLYYNLVFILPLIVVMGVMYMGKEVVGMREWEHKWGRWMRLVLGVILLISGYFIIYK